MRISWLGVVGNVDEVLTVTNDENGDKELATAGGSFNDSSDITSGGMSRTTNRTLNNEEIETSVQNGELSLRLYLWLSPDILDKESLNDYYDDYFTVSGEGAEATARLRGDMAIPDEIHVPSSIDGKVIFRVDFSDYINNNKGNLNLKILVDYSSSAVAGKGNFTDLSSLEKYIGIIKEDEHGIGESAFEGLKNLKEVQLTIYSNINIANNAFKDCSALQKLEFIGDGQSVTDIRESAFENCTSLQSIVFPKEKTNQGGMSGDGMSGGGMSGGGMSGGGIPGGGIPGGGIPGGGMSGDGMSGSGIPGGGIPGDGMSGGGMPEGGMPEGGMPGGGMPEGGMPGGGMLEITIKGDIYTKAFKGCNNISSLTINSCNNIEGRAFEGCKQLKEVKINNTNYIGEGVFKGCIIDTVIPQEEADKQDPTQMKAKEPTIQFTNVKQIGGIFFEEYKGLLESNLYYETEMLSCILDDDIYVEFDDFVGNEIDKEKLLTCISIKTLEDGNQINFKWSGQ